MLIKSPLTLLVWLGCLLPTANAEDLGWSVGAIIVSQDLITSSQRKNAQESPFPSIKLNGYQQSHKNIMMLPNVKWQGQQWSLGIEGLGWRTQSSPESIKLETQLGFPKSGYTVTKPIKWSELKLAQGLEINNGLFHQLELGVRPLSYQWTAGMGSDAGSYHHKINAGIPIYNNASLNIMSLLVGYYDWQNADYIENDLHLKPRRASLDLRNHSTSLKHDWYGHYGIEWVTLLLGFDHWRYILSVQIQKNDTDLQRQLTNMPNIQTNFFLLLNYQF